MKKSAWLFVFLRVLIGSLFIYSGYIKLMEPAANFTAAILGYQIVDARTASSMAVAVPWAEVVAGVFFLAGLWTGPALFLLWGLNAVFTAAICSALMRHLPIQNCGCFGEGAHAVPIQTTLALDGALFFVFLVMSLALEETSAVSLDRALKD